MFEITRRMSSATQRTHTITTENTRPTSFEVSTLQTQTLRIATMCHNTPFNQRFCLLHGIGSFNQRASARHTSEMRFTTVFKCGQLSFYFNQLALADVYSDVFMHTSANEIAVV